MGNAILRAFDQATSTIRNKIEIIFRAACAFFFISIWAVGGILLTPVTARLMREWLTEQRVSADWERFSPLRFQSGAGVSYHAPA